MDPRQRLSLRAWTPRPRRRPQRSIRFRPPWTAVAKPFLTGGALSVVSRRNAVERTRGLDPPRVESW